MRRAFHARDPTTVCERPILISHRLRAAPASTSDRARSRSVVVAHRAEQHDVDVCGPIFSQAGTHGRHALKRDVLFRDRAEPLEARELARDRSRSKLLANHAGTPGAGVRFDHECAATCGSSPLARRAEPRCACAIDDAMQSAMQTATAERQPAHTTRMVLEAAWTTPVGSDEGARPRCGCRSRTPTSSRRCWHACRAWRQPRCAAACSRC